MDNTNYTTEHRKGQHLLSEERHEIEVRLKDGPLIFLQSAYPPIRTYKRTVRKTTTPASTPIHAFQEGCAQHLQMPPSNR